MMYGIMAVITQSLWSASTGITVTGADATSIDAICSAVSAALTRKCYPIAIEPVSLTLFACDAPLGNQLFLPLRPCRAISALYVRPYANGDNSVLESTDLLTAGADYYMPLDPLTGWSMTGLVYRRGTSVWGAEVRYPITKLAGAVEPNRGAVFVSGTFGPTSVNAAVQEAAARAVTLLYNSRTQGGLAQSQSWNGGSFSLAAPVTAEGAINSPDVLELLRAAGVLPIHVG